MKSGITGVQETAGLLQRRIFPSQKKIQKVDVEELNILKNSKSKGTLKTVSGTSLFRFAVDCATTKVHPE